MFKSKFKNRTKNFHKKVTNLRSSSPTSFNQALKGQLMIGIS